MMLIIDMEHPPIFLVWYSLSIKNETTTYVCELIICLGDRDEDVGRERGKKRMPSTVEHRKRNVGL